MANGTTIGQSVLSSLIHLNAQLKIVNATLQKVEANESEIIKNNYELKNAIVMELKTSIQNITDLIFKIMSKLDQKYFEYDKNFENIKENINELKKFLQNYFNKNMNCESCLALAEKEKIQKKMWWSIVMLFLIVLFLLGLNLFGVIKLPGLGGL